MLALTGKAQAELGTSAARGALLLDQFKVLDSRAPKPKEDLLTLQTSRFSIPSNLGLSGYFGPYKGPYLSLARAAAQRYGVPEGLFLPLIEQKRGWGSKAISPKGAIGLAQLMPETARLLGVDPRVPAANLDGAARYLKTQNRAFRSWRLALAAYNAGPVRCARIKVCHPMPKLESTSQQF
jgi:soluble lytic murein transglycosylase-like protein